MSEVLGRKSILGPCAKCGRDLSESPAYLNLGLHETCFSLRVKEQYEERVKSQASAMSAFRDRVAR